MTDIVDELRNECLSSCQLPARPDGPSDEEAAGALTAMRGGGPPSRSTGFARHLPAGSRCIARPRTGPLLLPGSLRPCCQGDRRRRLAVRCQSPHVRPSGERRRPSRQWLFRDRPLDRIHPAPSGEMGALAGAAPSGIRGRGSGLPPGLVEGLLRALRRLACRVAFRRSGAVDGKQHRAGNDEQRAKGVVTPAVEVSRKSTTIIGVGNRTNLIQVARL